MGAEIALLLGLTRLGVLLVALGALTTIPAAMLVFGGGMKSRQAPVSRIA